MKESINKNILIVLGILIILGAAIVQTVVTTRSRFINAANSQMFEQPSVNYGTYPWAVRSIDTQVVSKHWPNVSQSAVEEQVKLLQNLGVNYIAIDTPYDKVDDMRIWTNEIHKLGIHVWFRSQWLEWEGDDGKPSTMTPEDYLKKTHQFILDNPDLFKEGDSFTTCVEAEQVGVGLGKRFLSWNEYRGFLLAEITVPSDAFSQIGLKGKIHTNWLSMNGWVVDNELDSQTVSKIGLIVVDHFVGQSKTIGKLENKDDIINQTISDLDRFYSQWSVPILLGEWGYQIYQNVDDARQSQVISDMFSKLKNKPYLVGINYWVHMGNSAAIIGDEFGTNLKYRSAADVIRSFYAPTSQSVIIGE